MDGNRRKQCWATSGMRFSEQANLILSDPNFFSSQNFGNSLVNPNYFPNPPIQPGLDPDILAHSSEVDPHEDYEFSDVVLKYINQMLMEEDIEEKSCMFQESVALQDAERSFYEVIGQEYTPPVNHQDVLYVDQKGNHVRANNNYYSNGSSETGILMGPNGNSDFREYDSALVQYGPADVRSQSNSHPSYSSSASTITDGPIDSPVSTLVIPDVFGDSQTRMQVQRGFEEASKFLPNRYDPLADSSHYALLHKEQNEYDEGLVAKSAKKCESEQLEGSKGRKNMHNEDTDLLGERSYKQSAVYSESTVRSKMFDMVLLCSGGKNESALREALKSASIKNTPEDDQSKGSNTKKSRGRKQGKRNVVDLRTLLTLCAQAVASGDSRTANDFLTQIREHASPTGDGMQRLAYYFANGLEARLAGSGTQIYKTLLALPTSAADILRAYHLYVSTCPFRKISNFFSNKTIANLSENAKKIHIIDFGILYGFQWPSFIQRLSTRPVRPKLRITGIDMPQPGFRPAERVEETGRRLTNYAESFNVPFEFNAIAQKWETVKVEDLNIDKDEVLIVSCLFRFRNLLDETVVVNSPRDIVLRLIRKINPNVFVLGIVNGAYNAPFFITRFREALFHYSSFFDMLEANIPREIHERMLLEKIVFGQEAMNVIACEAAERIERPETYKQWQVRNLRAGFRQLPLNEEIMKVAKNRVLSSYHKDFVIDRDGQWLLQGWKGRIVYALSSWKPAY